MISVKMHCYPDKRLLEILEEIYGEEGELNTKHILDLKDLKEDEDGALTATHVDQIEHHGSKILVVFAPVQFLDTKNSKLTAVQYRDGHAAMSRSQNLARREYYACHGVLMDVYEYNK